MKKLFIILFLMIALLPGALADDGADLTNHLVYYWEADSDDIVGSDFYEVNRDLDGTLVDNPYNTPGIRNDGIGFDGVTDGVNFGNNAGLNSAFTYVWWGRVNDTSCSSWEPFISKNDVDTGTGNYIFSTTNGCSALVRIIQSSSDYLQINGVNATFDTQGLNFIVWTYDGGSDATSQKIYVNGTEVGYTSRTKAGSFTGPASSTIDMRFGMEGDASRKLPAVMDEIMLFNKSLNTSEISWLYNSGSGRFYEDIRPTPENVSFLQIRLLDIADDGPLEGFNVTLANGVSNTTDSGGIALFTNYTSQNFTAVDPNGLYFDYSSTTDPTENITTTYRPHGAFVQIQGINILNETVDSFNVSANLQTNSTTTGILRLYLIPNSTNEVVIQGPELVPQTFEVNTTSRDTSQINFTGLYGTQYNITFLDGLDSLNIDNFSVSVNNSNISYFSTVETGAGTVASVPLVRGYNYTFTVSKDDYETQSVDLEANSTYQSYVVRTLPIPSLNITFYYEENLSIVDGVNVSLSVVGNTFSTVESTLDGNIFINELPAGDYTLIFESENYPSRFSNVEVPSLTVAEKDLYLVSPSDISNVTITVIDENANPVEGAAVKILRYYPSLGQEVEVVQKLTDIEGDSIVEVIKFSTLYRIMVEYEDETKLTTIRSTINKDSLTLQINIGSESLSSYSRYNQLDYALSFDTSANEFNAIYSTITGLASNICLDVDRINALNGTIDVSYTCSSASSGSITAPVTNTSGYYYRARLFAQDPVTLENNLLAVKTHQYTNTIVPEVNELIWQIFLTILAAFIALSSPKNALISVPASLLIGKLLYLNTFDWFVLNGLLVVGLIIYFGLKR